MGKQFSDVTGLFGAPMGRREYGTAANAGKIRLYRVRIDSGGYDDGGAYWGTGQPLYCAEGENYRQFIRANSRAAAVVSLGIVGQLARPCCRFIDARRVFPSGAWAITVELPDGFFKESQYVGYSKKDAIYLAIRERWTP